MRRTNQRQVALNLPSTSTVLSTVGNGALNFGKHHPKTVSFYFLGLLVALLASGTALSSGQKSQYNSIMSSVDTTLEYEAAREYKEAQAIWYNSKGWFSCDSFCQRNKSRMDAKKTTYDAVRAEGNARVSDAKAVAGVFSEVGVGEARDSFWEYFNRGAKFAKRQSMWDALFTGFRSMGRDESWGEYALKMLFQVLMNFTLGLTMTLCIFIIGLWSLIQSYQPTLLEGLAFFLLASAAGFATVVTVLGLMFGGAGGAVFTVAKVAEAQIRLQQEQGGGRRHLHQQ